MAYRLHSTLVNSDFSHDANISELAALHVVPYISICIACAIALFGNRILRPSVCVLGFSAGGMATLHILYTYASIIHNWNCEAIVAASIVVGGILATIGATLVSAVSIVLGCVAGASFAILLFDICVSCNTSLWTNAPMLLDRPLIPFWVTIAIASTIGGVVCRRRDKKILAFVTSVIGGWGCSVGIRLAAGAQSHTIPSWCSMLIAFFITLSGFSFQVWMMNKSNGAFRKKLWKTTQHDEKN